MPLKSDSLHHHVDLLDGNEHIWPHQESLLHGHSCTAAGNFPLAKLMNLGSMDGFRRERGSLSLAQDPGHCHPNLPSWSELPQEFALSGNCARALTGKWNDEYWQLIAGDHSVQLSGFGDVRIGNHSQNLIRLLFHPVELAQRKETPPIFCWWDLLHPPCFPASFVLPLFPFFYPLPLSSPRLLAYQPIIAKLSLMQESMQRNVSIALYEIGAVHAWHDIR